MAPPFHEAKHCRKDQSQKAQKAQQKRAIEKFFSQEQAEKKQANICDSDSETSSDIDFEVGGNVRSSRYKFVYMFVYCISGRNVHALIFLPSYFISEVESMKQGGKNVSPSAICSTQSGIVLVKSFEWKDRAAACKHLGLQLQHSKDHVYSPYESNFQRIDIPEVVQDCSANGDCFYRWVTK